MCLKRSGIDVTVISAKNKNDSAPEFELIDGIKVYRISSNIDRSISIYPTFFAFLGFKLLAYSRFREKIDILHMLAFPNLGVFIYPIPFSSTPGIKVLDIRATAVANPVFDLISRFILKIQRKLYRNVIVLSDRVADSLFADRKNIQIVPLGADFEMFKPDRSIYLSKRKELEIREHEKCMVYVGNFHFPRKLKRMIDAFNIALDHDPSLKLVMVGGGPDFENLVHYCRNVGISNKVIFTGYVDFDKVPELVQAADVGLSYVVDAVQYRNQPPIKTIEFLATGLPVVATATPGNLDFVADGHNGVVTDDSPNGYARGILRLITNPILFETCAGNARTSVAQNDYNHIVRNIMVPYYESLLASSIKAPRRARESFLHNRLGL